MKKLKIIGIFIVIILIAVIYLYFKYFFSYEQRNIIKRKIENVTGQNLRVSLLNFDGKVIKQWDKVQKITSGKGERNYTYFYTKDNKYVQIPNSVWYIAEEE